MAIDPTLNKIAFLSGFQIKPYSVNTLGEVLFTDGRNDDLVPSRAACEAYGYTYDKTSGTCKLNSQYSNNMLKAFQNDKMLVNGTENRMDIGTINGMMTGTDNQILGISHNSLIAGADNLINNAVHNSTVLGVRGNATRQSEVVIGGGKNKQSITVGEITTDLYSDRQMSIVELSGVTVNNTATNLTINGDGVNYINVKNNSIVGYEIYMTRFELGGTSGTAGNFSYRNLKGVARIDNSYNMVFITGFTRNIAKYDSGGGAGVNGSFSMVDSSTTDLKSMTIQVTDRNNVNNVWSAIVYIHEIISTSKTF